MSYYVVKPPNRTSPARNLVLGITALLVVLALLAGWAAAQPIRITVDGHTRYVTSGTTLYDLQKGGALESPKGRLLGVNGSVLLSDGGHLPTAQRNGRPCEPSQRLYGGDVLISQPGADRTESVISTEVPLPFRTRYEGKGPLTELKVLGSPGLARQQRGLVSGSEVTSTVVRQPIDTVILRMRPKGKVVALTFDDGPWGGQTDAVLDVLKQENVKATFFMVGKQAARHPLIARRVAREGHLVASHSWSHKPFDKLSKKAIRDQISHGRETVERVTGQRTSWIRPPYGAMDSLAWQQVHDLDVHAVLWDVDSRDWTKPGVKRLEKIVMHEVKPGSVILFHDGGGDRRQTVAALPKIISGLRKQGYQFVRVDELYRLRAEARAKQRVEPAANKKP